MRKLPEVMRNVILMAISVRMAYVFVYWTFSFDVWMYMRLWIFIAATTGVVAWAYGKGKE